MMQEKIEKNPSKTCISDSRAYYKLRQDQIETFFLLNLTKLQ